jgi:plastocyanin
MIHDLTAAPFQVWMTYDMDFIPATSPAAQGIRAVRPIWLDVQNGKVYPVFDVHQGSGNGTTFTYPTDADHPYGNGPALNKWTVDRDGVLVATGGHLHPGGLHDDLYVRRSGKEAHLFSSVADYFEPAGAVSWDVALTITQPTWRVKVKQGDVLRITTTYDSKRASWYEAMGIMVVWMADGAGGVDPFKHPVDAPGHITHGHLPENNHHGGENIGLGNATKQPNGVKDNQIGINHFSYGRGDLLKGDNPPIVKAGKSITFINREADQFNGVWHTLTACKAPCNKGAGIAYPLADGAGSFDSGQLGVAGPPTAGRITWQTPSNLTPGTYTYFCRIHPFMRGSFRVIP